MINKTRIILVNTSHPGNIGATARAMKTMGLTELYLVNPVDFPHEYATARAKGAQDILENAVITQSIGAALKDCHFSFAMTARSRSLTYPVLNPRECAQAIYQQPNQRAAILLGSERAGLTNEEIAYANFLVSIPTAEFSSLNLAAAVQIIAYEIKMLQTTPPSGEGILAPELASLDQLSLFYEHLQETLTHVEFLDPKQPKMLMRRLKRLFNRSQIDKTEINILRGILSAIQKKC